MKITDVGVRKLVTMEGYNNHAIEVRAIVEEGESPEAVLENLTVWIDDRMAYERSQRQLVSRGQNLAERITYLERDKATLEKVIEAGNALIAKHDALRDLAVAAKLEIPGLNALGDNLPF